MDRIQPLVLGLPSFPTVECPFNVKKRALKLDLLLELHGILEVNYVFKDKC